MPRRPRHPSPPILAPLFLAVPLAVPSLTAQAPANPQEATSAQAGDTVSVVANDAFLAGGTWRFIWGDHYREAWATPVRVPVLDLADFAGGLTPLRRGGGLQTRSLRFQGRDGRQYAFRSIRKDPSAVLPPELKETFAEEVLQDQISAQHPYGALVVDSILGAVGVLHSDPSLHVMPADPALGEFADFQEMLGLMEERPDENDSEMAAFYGADLVVGTERLFERIDETALDRVDPRAYLQARLVDFLLGDWDRHRDQWRWARFDDGPWQPIPRDRDQAFARLDGAIPSMARFAVPQLVGFSDEFISVFSLSWSARELDRRFLAGVEATVYDSVARHIQAVVTDAVIDGAVDKLPAEVRPLDADWIRQGLRGRRDALDQAARAFYLQLAREVDLHASDDDEVLVLSQLDGGPLELTLARADSPNAPYVRRTFSPGETEELRIRMHGGDDRVVVRGGARVPLTVRVVLGGGDDTVDHETPTRGVVFYDERGDLTVEGSTPDLDVRTRRYDEWEWTQEDPAPRRDWGSAPLFQADFGFSSDYGLLLGAGFRRIRFGFRRDPYATSVRGVFSASTTGKIEALFEAETWLEARPVRLFVRAGGTQFDVLHFYGFGNDVEAPESESFYDVERARVGVGMGVGVFIRPELELVLAPEILLNSTAENADRFIGTLPDLYGTGDLWQLGLLGGARWKSTGSLEGVRGTLVDLDGRMHPAAADVRSLFGTLEGVARVYLPLGTGPVSNLAFRVGGRKVWGDFPWFESAFLGGDNLRGLPAQRYAGDASLFGSAEIRFQVGRARILVPEMVGLTALADVGRVWLDGASPGGWHAGLGGGIWLAILNERNIVSVVYAVSEGGGRLHLDWGFAF